MIVWELQGCVDGDWAWWHLDGRHDGVSVDACYPSEGLAQMARSRLLASTDWHPDCVRVVEARACDTCSFPIANNAGDPSIMVDGGISCFACWQANEATRTLDEDEQ